MPLAVAAVLVVAATTLAALGGVRVGRRVQGRLGDGERAQLYALEASLLGLLALLLGFSFAMAQTRYDARKQLVIEEANALGTARLRTAAIADARAQEIEQILERYVTVRLRGYRQRGADFDSAVRESERLQREAWSRAADLARADPGSLPAALLLQSLNQVIDLHGERMAMGRNHIPPPVLWTLVFVAVVAMAWVGACVGVSARRGTGLVLLLAVVISAVITVIVDLDQPRSGLIRISQSTLADPQPSF